MAAGGGRVGGKAAVRQQRQQASNQSHVGVSQSKAALVAVGDGVADGRGVAALQHWGGRKERQIGFVGSAQEM